MSERWRKIRGWPYSVSDEGRVRNNRTGKILNPRNGRYKKVTLYRVVNGSRAAQRHHVHVLVCVAFRGEKPKWADCARHLDGRNHNNKLGNIEWGTHAQNEQDKRRHGTYKIGSRNPFSILTENEVAEIRKIYSLDEMSRAKLGFRKVTNGLIGKLASRFNVATNTIKQIAGGRGWSHV